MFFANLAAEISKSGVTLSTQGSDGMLKNLRILYDSTENKIDGLLSQLKSQQVKSPADAITMVDAYGNLAIAQGLLNYLKSVLSSESMSSEDSFRKFGLLIITPALANMKVQAAKDSLEIGFHEGKGTKPNSKLLGDYANLTEQAAQVNLNYFEAIFINPIADDKDVSANSVKAIFQSKDSDYAFAKAALEAIPDISAKVSRLPAVEKKKGPEDAALYAKLGASLVSYQLSAGLIAKYYSLGADFDFETQSIRSVKREYSLVKMLDSAETKAKDLLSLSDASGNNSSVLKIGFEQAAFEREGDVDSKINALQGFWDVGLKAELTSIFANKFKLK